MAKFLLDSVTSTPGDIPGRDEKVYTFISEDRKRGFQWRFHSTKSFFAVKLQAHKVSDLEIQTMVGTLIKGALYNKGKIPDHVYY
jgi:hypothetical protein